MSDPREAIHAFVTAHRADAIDMLASLVRTPSDNPPGDCAPHAERAAGLLEGLGLRVERHRLPPDEVARSAMRSCVNLIVRERFGPGPTIACNAHGDVVPPGAGWSVDPYAAEIREDRMYGRGVAVSKSDFATYAFALLALKAAAGAGATLSGAVELHFTHDEEIGGTLGPAWLLARGLTQPDYAICAGFAHSVTTAHNGCLHLEVDVRGRSGHAAEPEKGIDALRAASGILSGLYELSLDYAKARSRIPGIASPTLVVGMIEGGINTNVVPDRVVFRLDRRIIPEESPAEVEATLTRQIRELGACHAGVAVDVRRILLALPFLPLRGQEKLVEILRRNALAVLREEIPAHGVPLYTDARHYSAAGIPTVLYGAGPRMLAEANGHRADENLRLDDLHAAIEVVALSLYDLLAT